MKVFKIINNNKSKNQVKSKRGVIKIKWNNKKIMSKVKTLIRIN